MRESRGLTQADLAERVGIAPQQVLRYENGKNLPSSAVLSAFSKELEVSSDYLLGLVDEPQGKVSPNDLSPLEYKFLSAADHGDLEEMIRVALEIYKDYAPENNHGAAIVSGALGKAGKKRTAKQRE